MSRKQGIKVHIPPKNKKDVEHQLRYLALEGNCHCSWSSQAKEKALDILRLIDEEVIRLKNWI